MTNTRLRFVFGNIAEGQADAIVNPVGNGFLVGHAGVNGALRAAGGQEYAAECDRLSTSPTGRVCPTAAGTLKSRHVLHVVSPMWAGGAPRRTRSAP